MRNLHGVHAANVEQYLWCYVFGRTSRIIGGLPGGGIQTHAFLVPRGTPPRMGDPLLDATQWARDNQALIRQRWYPFSGWFNQDNTEEHLTPACGRLRTASRFPRITAVNAPDPTRPWGNFPRCPQCIEIVGEGNYIDTARTFDPWVQIPRQERGWTTDPVSGL